MRKNALIILIATLMIFSSLAVGLEYSPAGNSNSFQASPLISPGNTDVGNVTIYANGTVSNTSAVQQVGNTDTYNVDVNINGTLFIERNNTFVNGNGLTITGGSSSSSSAAIVSVNTTGITIENAAIGSSSYYGIYLSGVTNALVNNLTTVNFTGNALVKAYYSSNVTVENGNMSFYTNNDAMDFEYDSSVNFSYNKMTGFVNNYMAYFYVVGSVSAYGNNMLSNYSGSNGFYAYSIGNSVFAYNNVNNTAYAFDWYYAGSVLSIHNSATNNSFYGFYVAYATSYTSIHDVSTFGDYPVYVEYIGAVVVKDGSFSNFSSEANFYVYASVTISNSQFNTTAANEALYFEEGGNVNLINDSINTGTHYNAEAVYAEYISGWVNLANDNIYSPSGYAVYLYYAPLVNVTNSYLNVTNGVYFDHTSTNAATITNDTIILQNTGYAAYMEGNNVYNVNFSNNTVISPNSTWGYSALYVDAYYTSSNITFSNNTVYNNQYPVCIEAQNYGTNVKIQSNLIVNTTYGIEDFYYFNSVVTSNTVINVTDEGIYLYIEGPGVIVSNNLVENMPGFGQMSYGFYIEWVYGGNIVISHNTVLNAGSNSYGYFIDYVYGADVYSNTASNTYYAFYLEENLNLLMFGNTANTAFGYGIYSEYNYNVSYYGNTINNANTSFYSYEDVLVSIFSNTFHDTQANNTGLYFLSLEYYSGLTFYHNNFINDTTNSTTAFYNFDPNGPLSMNQPLPVGGNYYSNYTGSGANGIGSAPMNLTGSVSDLYPLLYKWTSPTVTFLENGLPSGTSWSVNLGSVHKAGSSSGLVFQQVNGRYSTESYSVTNVPGYVASVTSGSVSLDGSSSVVTINYSPVTYGVTFTESGLSSGTSWSVMLNGQTETSTSSTITFSVANGTYRYSIGAVSGYTTSATSGTVSVDGAPQSVSVPFTEVVQPLASYTLTVNETGLPAGDAWNVTVGGNTYNTTGTSITVQLTAGTYNVSVPGPSGYSAAIQSNNFTVSNQNVALAVVFSQTNGTANTATGSGTSYANIAIGAVVGGVAGTIVTMFYTGTGFFRKLRE